jgi:F-type H+-transporting ATPase subunit gamma
MANRRVLVKRRKAVRNIRKITRTMQLIATARFQSAFNRAVATRPYTETLAELADSLTQGDMELSHALLEKHEVEKRTAVVVITSGRGLCGGYNANVLKTATKKISALEEAGSEVALRVVGQKGINFFNFLDRPITESRTDIGDRPRFEQVEPIANELIEDFIHHRLDAVHVVYMRFFSTSRQRPEVLQLLPLHTPAEDGEEPAPSSSSAQYEFSPEPIQILEELLPATVRIRLFQCFTDAAVSEQVARMVAMKAATDAAEEMITTLTRQYNRARQTAITMELLDIVGGANALA